MTSGRSRLSAITCCLRRTKTLPSPVILKRLAQLIFELGRRGIQIFPGKLEGQPAGNGALAQALRKLKKNIGKKITSHGMRTFYVLIRRSQNVSDDQIALELGQRSGGGLIATVYGDVPENWRNGGGPNLTWMPKKPVWSSYE